MTRRTPWTPLALLGFLVALAACAEIRANERPQPTNPLWSPTPQGGNRP